MLETSPKEFTDLIKEKTLDSTVIYLKSLYDLKEALNEVEDSKLMPNINILRLLLMSL